MKYAPYVCLAIDVLFAIVWAVLSVGSYYGESPTGVILCALASLYSCAEVVYGPQTWDYTMFEIDRKALELVKPGTLFIKNGVLYEAKSIVGNQLVLAKRPTWQQRVRWWANGRYIPGDAA